MNYLFWGLTIVVFGLIYVIFRKFIEKYNGIILKVLSVVLFACFFIRYFASTTNMLSNVVGFTQNNPFPSNFLCVVMTILVWLSFANIVILQITPYFNLKVLTNYAKTFCLVLSVLNSCFLSQFVFVYSGNYGVSLSSVFLSIEVALCLLLSVYHFVKNKYFKMEKSEIIDMLKLLPIILLFNIPPYLPRIVFGNVGNLFSKGFALYHRLFLYLSFIFLFGLYFALKNKTKEYAKMVLLYISLVSLIAYVWNHDFSMFIDVTSWPLHLCNTAMFIVPLCLIFKWEKLFYFTLFINVLGAFLAMLMPNYGTSELVFSPGIVRFWINHIIAFAMPILIIILKIYPRPRLKHFVYSMVAFLIYFLFVLIANAWLTNYDNGVDFFFINSDFIAEKLGKWAENIREKYVSTIYIREDFKLIFYPLYQFLFFVVYIALGLGIWFLYVYLFQFQDFYINLNEKKQKIKLDEIALCAKYGKKEVGECMNQESVDKLVVKNASKCYGGSSVYSLNDASFEVHGGEVLGFLGPNGAGKSTLIKSVVGMQPLTSGSIEINGYDIAKQPVLAKSQIGFVPDHYALYEKLTGREYINYIADLYDVPKEERDKIVDKLVKDLQMDFAFDNQIRTYSHGMKQKIAIMSALVHKPKLWILDEPLTGLDPTSIHQVKECMKNHAKEGNIVFFSSHLIDIVEKLCDRIIIIKKGRIQTEARLDDLKKNNIDLEQFYLQAIHEDPAGDDAPINDKGKTNKPKKRQKQSV